MNSFVALLLAFAAAANGALVLSTVERTQDVRGSFSFTANNQTFLVDFKKEKIIDPPSGGFFSFSGLFMKNTIINNGAGFSLSISEAFPCDGVAGSLKSFASNSEGPSESAQHQILKSYAYETADETKHDEAGTLKNAGAENEAIAVTGSFTYLGPDGVTYTVTYVTDDNGFQPSGVHLPLAPIA